MRLRVVIPTLNEAASLAACLASVDAQSHRAEAVVVSDGGSTDDTLAIAASAGATIVRSPQRGRGFQIAAGLAGGTEDAILVVHGDMQLATDSHARIAASLTACPDSPGGCLGHRFNLSGEEPGDSSRGPAVPFGMRLGLRLVEAGDRWRAERRGISYGDQGQFVRWDWLDANGGFPRQPILEDLELALRMRSGPGAFPRYLDCPVLVSPRRFAKRGLLRSLWLNLHVRRRYDQLRRQAGGKDLPANSWEEIYRQYYGRSSVSARSGPAEGENSGRNDCAENAGTGRRQTE